MRHYILFGVLIIGVLAAIIAGPAFGADDLTFDRIVFWHSNTDNLTTVTVWFYDKHQDGCSQNFWIKFGFACDEFEGLPNARYLECYHIVPGLLPGAAGYKSSSLSWPSSGCYYASGYIDYPDDVAETDESNNFISTPNMTAHFPPPGSWSESVTVYNWGIDVEEYNLYTNAPPEWSVTFSNDNFVLSPDEYLIVNITFDTPPDFTGHEEIIVVAEPLDGTPGLFEFVFHMLSQPTITDAVACEPQGDGNPDHPPTYWYDVTPGEFGRCSFHVQVYDPFPSHYSNPSLPSPSWQFAVHQVGQTWWASWWDQECQNAIFDTFRFQFDNSNRSTWGSWSTTVGASSDPYSQLIDISTAHQGDENGYGGLVHVPCLTYFCGDPNSDGNVNVGDVVYLINYVFLGGPPPNPECLGDTNGDDAVNIADAVYLISYIFKFGPPPVNDCCM